MKYKHALPSTPTAVCIRACMCMRVSARARVCVCVCHYEKKIAAAVLVVSLRCCCCCCAVQSIQTMLWERFLFAVISEYFTEFFTACYTFLLLLCRKVGGGRKTASKMSAKRLYEQARATLRTKQRGTDGRVKEHKRQRKQIISLSLFLSFILSFSLYASVTIIVFGLTSFFMTNTLILHVSCVYFLSSFSLFLCVFLLFGYLHRAFH